MSFTYCKSCGHKNLYALSPPKFCGECGTELGSAVSKAVTRKKIQKENPSQTIDDENGLDVFEVPSIKKFQFNIKSSEIGSRKFKMGDLVPNIDSQAKALKPENEE